MSHYPFQSEQFHLFPNHSLSQPTLHSTPKRTFLTPKSNQDTVVQNQVHTLGLSPLIFPSPISIYSPTDASPCHKPCCIHTRHTLSSSHTRPFHLEHCHDSRSACKTLTTSSRQPPHACPVRTDLSLLRAPTDPQLHLHHSPPTSQLKL